MSETTYENVAPPTPIHRIISLLRVGPFAIILRLVDQSLRLLTGSPVWRLSKVTEQVYLGGQHYPRGWDVMTDEGINAVLNMREAKFDDAGQGIGGEHHLHLPTRDNTAPGLEDLENAAIFVNEQVSRGHRVYIHCGVGVGRAPSATAAYFI
ncbi:MAG: protein-tyrosine phosphatase family protein, partial [Aggregatilineales bacterium]